MSRTYKDRPYKIRYPREYRDDYVIYKEEYWLQTHIWTYDEKVRSSVEELLPFPIWRCRKWEIQAPTSKPKVKRSAITKNYCWYKKTPSWWSRMFMNRPQRHKGRQWERKVLFEDIEDTDPPGVSRKPHIFYW